MNWKRADDIGKLILRLALGIMILLHGIAKIKGGVGPITGMLGAIGLPSFFVYGVFFGEVLGPLLLITGWYARLGALLITINMLFAFTLAHRAQLMMLGPQGGWALELQGMYLFAALALVFMGPGRLGFNSR